MASITTIPFVRHLRGSATTYVVHSADGRIRHQGTGSSFWFRPLTAAISEVPVDDREQHVAIRVRSTDLQEASVPGTITYRFAEPDLAAGRIDFSIDLAKGAWLERPLESVGSMIYGAAADAVTGELAAYDLRALLGLDPAALGASVAARLSADPRLRAVGIAIVQVRFGLVKPDPDVERALQTPAREVMQQEADKATFERRARAVEREAAIGENELANQIELTRRQELLIAQKGANARKQAQDAAAADKIAAAAEAERTTVIATAGAEADRLLGQAAAERERATLHAYDDVSRDVLLALALRELAQNLPNVEQLVLTPDVVTGLMARLGAPTATNERS